MSYRRVRFIDSALCVLLVVVLSALPTSLSGQTYGDWRSDVFLPEQALDGSVSGPLGDPDDDGRANWLEYAFGSNPLSPDPAGNVPSIEWRDGRAVVIFSKRVIASDLVFVVEGTPDLSLPWSLRNPRSSAEYELADGIERGWYPDPVVEADHRRYFWRLRVLHPAEAPPELSPPVVARAQTQLEQFVDRDGLLSFFGNRIDWVDRSIAESGYRLERRLEGQGTWMEVGGVPADHTLFRDGTTDGGTLYEYRVVVLDATGTAAGMSNSVMAPLTPSDSDGDGLPDALELGSTYAGLPGTWATNANTARSGPHEAPDGWWARRGLNPFSSFEQDTDGDGRPDWIEYLHGTDPRVAEELSDAALRAPTGLRLETGENGVHSLTWQADGVGRWTLVERSLDGRNWTTAAVVPASVTGFTDSEAAPGTLFFYRLCALD